MTWLEGVGLPEQGVSEIKILSTLRHRVAGGLLRGLPLLAPHVVERVVRPLHDMERVHHPPRVRAPAPDQRLYPLGAVGRHDLDRPPLLACELVEEKPEHLLAVPLVGPYEAASSWSTTTVRYLWPFL